MDNINSLANHWASWMAGMSWQLCVLVVALLLIDPLLRRRSATIRYGIWSLVLLRLVLPPTFALPTGWGWWTAEWSVTANSTSASPVTNSSAIERSQATTQELSSKPRITSPRYLVLADESVESRPSRELTAKESATGTGWQSLTQPAIAKFFAAAPMLLLLYLGIVCAQLGMLFSSSLQVRSWAAKARLIIDPAIQQRFDECRERVGLESHVELRDSEACTTPLVVGFWRPVILIPSTILEKLTDEELAAVLTHELQHIRRRDGLVNLAQAILGVIYFFHPLLWLANARIRALREDVCDEFTLNTLDHGPRPYGSALIKVAETLGYAAPPLAMGVLDGKTPLKQRMLRILDPRTASHNPWGLQAFVVTTLVALVLLPGGSPANGNKWNVVAFFQPAKPVARASQSPSNSASRIAEQEGAGPATSRTGKTPSPAMSSPAEPLDPPAMPQVADNGVKADPDRYFQGEERRLQYLADVAVDNGGHSQRFTGVVVYEILAANDKSVVTMFRPHLQQELVTVEGAALAPGQAFLSSRWLTQAHPQGWSRWGVATPNDGQPLPFLHRSFASLLLPWLPATDEAEVRETRSWSIEYPNWLTAPDRGAGGHPLDHMAPPGFRVPVGPFGPYGSGFDPSIPPWERRATPKLHMSETRVSRRLGVDAEGRLLVQESIRQQSDGDGQVKLEGTVTATVDPVLQLPLETTAHITLSRNDHGQWIELPLRITFVHVETE